MPPPPPFRHLMDILWRREYGFYNPYPQRSCDDMMRSIYKDKANNFFDCIYQKASLKRIYAIENRLYFDNLNVCETFYGHEKPQLQYRKEDFQSKEIVDFTSINAIGLEQAPIPKAEFQNVFYILDEQSILIEKDLLTGERLRSVYLSDHRLCKFKNISFSDELNRMYIESKRYPRKELNPDVIFSIVLFKTFPLQLIGHVELTIALFKNDLYPQRMLMYIEFQNDLLIAFHGLSRERLRVFIYDFDKILCPSNKLFDVQLYKHCGRFGVVGHNPTGIPVNYHVKNLPPALYVIERPVESIQFSPLPALHVVGREKGIYEVFDTASQKLIGRLGHTMNSIEMWNYDLDEYAVLMDFYGRVILKNNKQILVYNIKKKLCFKELPDQESKSLLLDFELKLSEENDNKKVENDQKEIKSHNLPSRVMPARSSKTKNVHNLCEIWIRVCAFHYFDSLDLFVVLADIPSYAGTGSVLMYDAFDGQLMLQFHTPFKITNKDYYDIHLYYDYIFIVEKEINTQKGRVFVFHLSRDVEPIDVVD